MSFFTTPTDPNVFELCQVLRATVHEWLNRFRRNSQRAQVELLNFLFEACGVEGRHPPVAPGRDVRDVDMQDLVAKLAVVERAVSGKLLSVYPCAIDAPAPLKKFRANFEEFMDKFVTEGGIELVSTGILQQLVEWLTVIASSSWLPFRHTAALATGQLIKSLIKEVLQRAAKDLDKHQRQALAEEKKNGGAPTGRSRGILARVAKTKQLISLAEKEIVTVAFNSLFMHLYRDSRSCVRADLLKYYGSWIALCPKIFLRDQRTKYLGWMLHDTDAGVRVSAVKALRQVYESTGASATKLQNFTLRFKGRIVEMIQDTDAKVACEVFGLLETLFGHGVLTEEDIFAACDAVFVLPSAPEATRTCLSDARKLSYAAARFALLAVSGFRPANSASTASNIATRRIYAFVAFVVDHASHGGESGVGCKGAILSLCDCAVDAFWKHTEAGGATFLLNWKSMLLLLLADSRSVHAGQGGRVSATDHQLLLRILCSCAQRACFPNEGPNATFVSSRVLVPGAEKAPSNVNRHRKEFSQEFVDARN